MSQSKMRKLDLVGFSAGHEVFYKNIKGHEDALTVIESTPILSELKAVTKVLHRMQGKNANEALTRLDNLIKDIEGER